MESKFIIWDSLNEEMYRGINPFLFKKTKNGFASISIKFIQEKFQFKPKKENLFVIQYTGRKDENKVDIYDGDIFGERNEKDDLEYSGIVVFDNDLSAWVVELRNGGFEYLGEYLNQKIWPKVVIGNKFQNPELMEVK